METGVALCSGMKLPGAEPNTSLRSVGVSPGVLRTQDLLENQRFSKTLLRGTHAANRGEIATHIIPISCVKYLTSR